MDGQLSFASLDFSGKKKRTKRDVFLAEMAAAVPWSVLESLIEPHYPKLGPQGGRRPFPIAVMLRIYCLQQWYQLSDPGAEEALYDIQSMRAFCNLELGRDPIPDETTILNFRHLLETHGVTKAVFEAVADHLEARGALLRGGTIVDATLIAASPSTKNAAGQRDPEMRSSKKGNQWRVLRTQATDLWCCTEDGSGPPEVGLQEQASNHPVLLRAKDVVVSDRGKVTRRSIASA